MPLFTIIIAALIVALWATEADARSARQQFSVPTARGAVLVESLGECANRTCPAVLLLSGSRGFGSPVYDEIGERLRAAGLKPYLVHILSARDLDAIARAGGARARIAYYAQRFPDWISAVQSVAASLKAQPLHGGRLGLLGVSLGAQITAAVSAGPSPVDALVLVDGGLPPGSSQPVKSWPPLLLIWGSADQTFPLSIGRDCSDRLGGSAGRSPSISMMAARMIFSCAPEPATPPQLTAARPISWPRICRDRAGCAGTISAAGVAGRSGLEIRRRHRECRPRLSPPCSNPRPASRPHSSSRPGAAPAPGPTSVFVSRASCS